MSFWGSFQPAADHKMVFSVFSFADISARLNQVGDELGEAVNIQRADIFDAMHRI